MTGEKDATAEVPEIYRIADEFERELFAWRNLPSRDGAALRACAYALAQKAETLFAPILAEKDGYKEIVRQAAEARDAAGYIGAVWDCIDDLSARALAAEAALAAEREKAHYANGVAELAMKHRDEAEREALRDELSQIEAAAPLSARETARYLQVERRLLELDAAAIRAQGE